MSYINIFIDHFNDSSMKYIAAGLLAMSVALFVEFCFSSHGNSTLHELIALKFSKALITDFLIWGVYISGVGTLVGKIMTLGFFHFILQKIYDLKWILIDFNQVQFFKKNNIEILVLIVCADFIAYWIHRGFHQFASIWELHKFHHSAKEFNLFTGFRGNPVGLPISNFFYSLPFIIFGVAVDMPIFVTIFLSAHTMLIHSKINSDWCWFGKWILMSPNNHKLHHSSDTENSNKNFSFIFPLWDHLFGTFCEAKKVPITTGISGYQIQPYFFINIYDDTVKSFSLLLNNVKKLVSIKTQ